MGGAYALSQLALIAAVSVCGLLGAVAGHRLRIPAGAFTGAMLGVGVALGAMGFPEISTPPLAGWGLQVLVGVLVGLRITRSSLRFGARALLPAVLLSVLFLVSGLVAALAAIVLTGMDALTALFASAIGGLAEMATIGATQGANGPAVAAIHLVRLLLVIFAANLLLTRLRGKQAPPETKPSVEWGGTPRFGAPKLAVIAAAGIAGGAFGLAATPLPAGGVIGSLAGAGAARFLMVGFVPQRRFQLSVQTLAGGIIGLGFSARFFETLAQLAGAAVVISATQMLVWVLACYLLLRTFRFDLTTATFASAPGGMGTILSITGETHADMVTVTFVHLLRVSTTVIVFPLLAATLFP